MKINKIVLSLFLLLPFYRISYAKDCNPDGLGGSFCVYDDGTTSNSSPNEQDGQDTLYSNGQWSSSYQDGTGIEFSVSNNGATEKPDTDESSNEDTQPDAPNLLNDDPKPIQNNTALDNHWGSSSEYNSNGAATSSINLNNSPSNKWP